MGSFSHLFRLWQVLPVLFCMLSAGFAASGRDTLSTIFEEDTNVVYQPQEPGARPESVECFPPCPEGQACNDLGDCIGVPTVTAPMQESPGRNDIAPESSAPVDVPLRLGGPPNMFRFGKTKLVGFNIGYFYYEELNLMEEAVRQYVEMMKEQPLTILGEPKSSEYGLLPGFSYSVIKSGGGVHGVYRRPNFGVVFGFNNTYDGSTQAQPVTNGSGNTVGMQFDPVTMQKFNLFLNGGYQIGYRMSAHPFSWSIYGGVRGKFWYRSMNDINMITTTEATMAETYFAMNLSPLGVLAILPLGKRWTISCDIALELMAFGFMDISATFSEPGVTLNAEQVDLGSKPCSMFEVAFQGWVNERTSIRIAPYFLLYGYGKSNTGTMTLEYYGDPQASTSFYEPGSRTLWGGLTITFGFSTDPISVSVR